MLKHANNDAKNVLAVTVAQVDKSHSQSTNSRISVTAKSLLTLANDS